MIASVEVMDDIERAPVESGGIEMSPAREKQKIPLSTLVAKRVSSDCDGSKLAMTNKISLSLIEWIKSKTCNRTRMPE